MASGLCADLRYELCRVLDTDDLYVLRSTAYEFWEILPVETIHKFFQRSHPEITHNYTMTDAIANLSSVEYLHYLKMRDFVYIFCSCLTRDFLKHKKILALQYLFRNDSPENCIVPQHRNCHQERSLRQPIYYDEITLTQMGQYILETGNRDSPWLVHFMKLLPDDISERIMLRLIDIFDSELTFTQCKNIKETTLRHIDRWSTATLGKCLEYMKQRENCFSVSSCNVDVNSKFSYIWKHFSTSLAEIGRDLLILYVVPDELENPIWSVFIQKHFEVLRGYQNLPKRFSWIRLLQLILFENDENSKVIQTLEDALQNDNFFRVMSLLESFSGSVSSERIAFITVWLLHFHKCNANEIRRTLVMCSHFQFTIEQVEDFWNNYGFLDFLNHIERQFTLFVNYKVYEDNIDHIYVLRQVMKFMNRHTPEQIRIIQTTKSYPVLRTFARVAEVLKISDNNLIHPDVFLKEFCSSSSNFALCVKDAIVSQKFSWFPCLIERAATSIAPICVLHIISDHVDESKFDDQNDELLRQLKLLVFATIRGASNSYPLGFHLSRKFIELFVTRIEVADFVGKRRLTYLPQSDEIVYVINIDE